MDFRAALGRITTPTLVIGGDLDVSMPWPDHGGRCWPRPSPAPTPSACPPRTSPTSNARARSRPRSSRFCSRRRRTGSRRGSCVRRAVLGDAHVDRAINATTALNQDFQDAAHRVRVGDASGRAPAWTDRTRRLLVLTATAALGRWEEFRLHLRTGLAHELEWCDVTEVLMQAAVYAGVPAANTGFQIAAEEMRGRTGRPIRLAEGLKHVIIVQLVVEVPQEQRPPNVECVHGSEEDSCRRTVAAGRVTPQRTAHRTGTPAEAVGLMQLLPGAKRRGWSVIQMVRSVDMSRLSQTRVQVERRSRVDVRYPRQLVEHAHRMHASAQRSGSGDSNTLRQRASSMMAPAVDPR